MTNEEIQQQFHIASQVIDAHQESMQGLLERIEGIEAAIKLIFTTLREVKPNAQH